MLGINIHIQITLSGCVFSLKSSKGRKSLCFCVVMRARIKTMPSVFWGVGYSLSFYSCACHRYRLHLLFRFPTVGHCFTEGVTVTVRCESFSNCMQKIFVITLRTFSAIELSEIPVKNV